MNILNQFNQLFGTVERGVAKVTGIKSDETLIATTPSGATVLLTGKAEIGKSVFYNRENNRVVDIAPDVVYKTYAI